MANSPPIYSAPVSDRTRSIAPARAMPIWLVFTLLTLVLWGGWGLVSKPLSTTLSPWQIQAFSSVGFVPVIVLLLWVVRGDSCPNSRRGLCLAFASGLLSSLGNVAYYQALGAGDKAAAVTPLTSLYSLVTILLAVWLLGERISGREGAGIVLAVVAAAALSWEKPASKTALPVPRKTDIPS